MSLTTIVPAGPGSHSTKKSNSLRQRLKEATTIYLKGTIGHITNRKGNVGCYHWFKLLLWTLRAVFPHPSYNCKRASLKKGKDDDRKEKKEKSSNKCKLEKKRRRKKRKSENFLENNDPFPALAC